MAEQVINTIDELEENNHIPIDLTDDLKICRVKKCDKYEYDILKSGYDFHRDF